MAVMAVVIQVMVVVLVDTEEDSDHQVLEVATLEDLESDLGILKTVDEQEKMNETINMQTIERNFEIWKAQQENFAAVLANESEDDVGSPVNKRARRASYDLPADSRTKESNFSFELPEIDNQSAGPIDLTQSMDEDNEVEASSSSSLSHELIVLSDDEVNYSMMRAQSLYKNDKNTSIINCLSNPAAVEAEHDAIYDDSLTQALAIAAALEPCSPPAASPVAETLEMHAIENSHEVQVNGVTYLVCESNSPTPMYECMSDAHLPQNSMGDVIMPPPPPPLKVDAQQLLIMQRYNISGIVIMFR